MACGSLIQMEYRTYSMLCWKSIDLLTRNFSFVISTIYLNNLGKHFDLGAFGISLILIVGFAHLLVTGTLPGS